ncbi:hypothetical protein V500_09860 [Pseudogymnoascus sp. VKM F-4518 (FW-2643)]|nr:hypothetical protein V500_09860 [Pseudogymnoascus sp. VKM F-4518 (FW-2643)]
MSAPAPPGMGLAGKMPEHGLIIIVWVATGLAGCFVVARTAIRIKKIERLHVDDYIIYAAFLVLVANAVLQTLQTPHCYNLARLVNGLSTLTEEETMVSGNTYMRYEFTIIGLFWTVLWLVKASFLAFFYKLFDGLQAYRRIWWGVVVFAFLSYVGCWIVSINVCHPAKNYFIFGSCNKEIDMKTSIVAVMYSTVVDVLTDIMIMAMPLRLLWKVRISGSEKMGLAGVFGIGVLIIIFAIARAVQIAFTTTSDSVLLALWGIIESTVCHPQLDTHTPLYDMAGITSLPLEILIEILSYLPRKQDEPRKQDGVDCDSINQPSGLPVYLPAYAAVCKTWQQQIELQTFQEIDVMSSEIEYLSEIMTESRRSALRVIKYSITMSEDVEAACSKATRKQIRWAAKKEAEEAAFKAANGAFTAAITTLLELLLEWEEYGPLMSLSLDILRVDSYKKGQRVKSGGQWNSIEEDATDMFKRLSLILHLGTLDDLPELKSVTRLNVHPSFSSSTTTDSAINLAIKFSALKILDLELDDMQWNDWGEKLVPEFRHEPPSILHSTAPEIDCLSLALYAISIIPTMKDMEILNFMVSPQLFQPPASIPADSEFAYLAKTIPKWPSLISYSIRFSTMRPSGSWYFVRHPDNPRPINFQTPDSDSDEYNETFRTYPDDESMNEMLSAAGKAKREMPVLQLLSLFAKIGGIDSLDFEATWSKSGSLHYTDLEYNRIATQPLGMSKDAFLAGDRVYWCTGSGRDWRPTREVEEAWVGNGNQGWFKRFIFRPSALTYGGTLF